MEKKKETDVGFWVVAIILAAFAVLIAATTIKLYSIGDNKETPANGTDVP